MRRGGGEQRRREGAEPRCGFYSCTWDWYCNLVYICGYCTWDEYFQYTCTKYCHLVHTSCT